MRAAYLLSFAVVASATASASASASSASTFAAPQLQCYYPNDIAGSSAYQPCSTNSMCCGKAYGDTCLPNGLCLATDGRVYRDKCADSWESDRCLPICIDIENKGDYNDTIVTPCDDGSICCGSNNIKCCVEKAGVWIENNDGRFTVHTTTWSSSTSAAFPTPTSLVPAPSPTTFTTLTLSPSTTTTSSAAATSTGTTEPPTGSGIELKWVIVGSLAGTLGTFIMLLFGLNQIRHWHDKRSVRQQIHPRVMVDEIRWIRSRVISG